MIKKKYTINNVDARQQCAKSINYLDTDKGLEVWIIQPDKLKTKEQCALFHTALAEFVKLLQQTGAKGCDWNFGRWKYEIKKRAEFLNSRKGYLFAPDEAREINSHLNKLPANVKEKICEAMRMETKSISEATSAEISNLIDVLQITILETLPKDRINTSEMLAEMMVKTKNNLDCYEGVLSEKQQRLLELLNEF